MKKWLQRLTRKEPLLRGRVSRVSVIRGGELSVVVRFGIEEFYEAQKMHPGQLVVMSMIDVVPLTAGKAAVAILEHEKKKRPTETSP